MASPLSAAMAVLMHAGSTLVHDFEYRFIPKARGYRANRTATYSRKLGVNVRIAPGKATDWKKLLKGQTCGARECARRRRQMERASAKMLTSTRDEIFVAGSQVGLATARALGQVERALQHG